MKVKKFYGSDNRDAIAKVRNELGSNAVILHQRKVRPKGLLGVFRKPIVEVVAAIEDLSSSTMRSNILSTAKIQELSLREKVALKSKENKDLEKDMNEIKTILNNVTRQIENINMSKPFNRLDAIKNSYIYNMLRENEVDEDLILDLLKDHIKDLKQLQLSDKKKIRDFLAQTMPKNISNNEIDLNSKIIFFIGPTGVGKTTTIAKLAANYNLEKGLNVGLISADTYRIAAVEQLKVYSDILSLPLEVIYSPDEIHDAINRLNNQDIIMVDTAGRSHKNYEHIKELTLLLDEVKNKRVYLVVSSTTRNSDLKDILNTYAFLENYKIIFTKLDEVSTYGPILNIAMTEPESLSYITTGQSVPDDIEMITLNKILDMLLKEF